MLTDPSQRIRQHDTTGVQSLTSAGLGFPSASCPGSSGNEAESFLSICAPAVECPPLEVPTAADVIYVGATFKPG